MLRQSELFADLSAEDLTALLAMVREVVLEPGANVFREGRPAETLFLVAEGRVALEKEIILHRREGARRVTFDVVTPGQVLGWSALVPSQTYTASANCLERTFLLALDGEFLGRWLEDRPRLGHLVMNRLAGVVASRLRDTTDRLTHLLSVASHDLKAPLSAVNSYLHVMRAGVAGPVPDKQQDMLARCGERLDEALDLVNNLLDISHLESVQMQNEMETMPAAEVLRRSVDVVRPAANDKDVALEVTLSEGLPSIRVVPLRLQQALVNVLSNAVRFAEPGGQIQIDVASTESSVRVEIVDNGAGIPAEDLPHVFDDFYHGRNVEGVGTGPGLSIAKRIILGHGGTIWAESPVRPEADAKGSRFVITLPRKASS